MKSILIILSIALSLPTFGQKDNDDKNCLLCLGSKKEKKDKFEQQTLLGGGKPSLRAYISLNSKVLELNNQFGVLTGGEFDLVFNHKFNVGFFGYGMVNDVRSNFVDTQGYQHFYEMGMGGIKLEPVILSSSAIHFTFPVEMGLGAMSLNRNRIYDYNSYQNNDWESTLYDYDVFAFIEPGVRAELNLFKHLRLSAGVGYNFTDEIQLAGTNARPLDGLKGNVSLKLGWF